MTKLIEMVNNCKNIWWWHNSLLRQ